MVESPDQSPIFRRVILKKLSCPGVFLILAAAVAIPRVASASVFTFDSDAVNTATPFADVSGGLTATFGGQAAVCEVTGLFQSLSGNALIQDLCVGGESGPISISFSSDINGITFNFATALGADTDTLTALENGNIVGSAVFNSIAPFGFPNGEGVATLNGVFNSITFTSNTNDVVAIDNVNAIPEPSTIALLIPSLGFLGLMMRRRR
jgi:hypothetical protein